MFFNSKKKEEELAREQELYRKVQTIEAFTQSIEQISEYKNQAMHLLEKIDEDKDTFNNTLQQAENKLNDIQQSIEEHFSREQTLIDIIKGMMERIAETEKRYLEFCQVVRNQEENFKEILEKGQLFQEMIEKREQLKEKQCEKEQIDYDITEDLQGLENFKVDEQLSQIKESGRTMEMLSLNAAIEAGRMGEAGKKFMSVSQEICDLSGNCLQVVDSLQEHMEEMELHAKEQSIQLSECKKKLAENEIELSATKEQLEQLTGLLQETHVLVGSTERELQEHIVPQDEGSNSEWIDTSKNLLEEFQKSADFTQEQNVNFTQVRTYIEQAEETHSKEYQILDNIKENWNKVQIAAEQVKMLQASLEDMG